MKGLNGESLNGTATVQLLQLGVVRKHAQLVGVERHALAQLLGWKDADSMNSSIYALRSGASEKLSRPISERLEALYDMVNL